MTVGKTHPTLFYPLRITIVNNNLLIITYYRSQICTRRDEK